MLTEVGLELLGLGRLFRVFLLHFFRRSCFRLLGLFRSLVSNLHRLVLKLRHINTGQIARWLNFAGSLLKPLLYRFVRLYFGDKLGQLLFSLDRGVAVVQFNQAVSRPTLGVLELLVSRLTDNDVFEDLRNLRGLRQRKCFFNTIGESCNFLRLILRQCKRLTLFRLLLSLLFNFGHR